MAFGESSAMCQTLREIWCSLRVRCTLVVPLSATVLLVSGKVSVMADVCLHTTQMLRALQQTRVSSATCSVFHGAFGWWHWQFRAPHVALRIASTRFVQRMRTATGDWCERVKEGASALVASAGFCASYNTSPGKLFLTNVCLRPWSAPRVVVCLGVAILDSFVAECFFRFLALERWLSATHFSGTPSGSAEGMGDPIHRLGGGILDGYNS